LEHSNVVAKDGRVSGELSALQQVPSSSNGAAGSVQTQAVMLNSNEDNQPGVAAPGSAALGRYREYLSNVRKITFEMAELQYYSICIIYISPIHHLITSEK